MSTWTTDTTAGDPITWARALGVTTGDALEVEVSRMARGVEDLWERVGGFADHVTGLAVHGDLTDRMTAARVELGEALTILEDTARRASQYGHLTTGGSGGGGS